MDLKIEQCVVIKFLINSSEKLPKIFLKVFRNECTSKDRVFEWASRFKEGRRSVYDNERPGAPVMVTTNANVTRLHALLTTDCHLTTRMPSVELGINCETTHQLLHDKLHMRKLRTKLVPNAPAHSSLAVSEYLEKIFSHCHNHPTAQPRPCDFFFVHQPQVGVERDATH